MGKKTVWYGRRHMCKNGVVEETRYPVTLQSEKLTRRQKQRTAKKSGRAADNAERQAGRLLNNNFAVPYSVHILLTYSESGYKKLVTRSEALIAASMDERDAIYKAAQKELENAVRRVQYVRKGIKYLAITSDMNGKTLEPVRVHHHVVIERECLELWREKWARMGFTVERELYAVNGDLSPMATYMLKQVRYIPDSKRYTPSRNLTMPEASEPFEITYNPLDEITIPNGAQLLYRAQYAPGLSQYVRYLAPRTWMKLQQTGEITRSAITSGQLAGTPCAIKRISADIL